MTIEVFIKKPEKVEVLKYDGTNYYEVVKFVGERFWKIEGCFVKGDYIVKSPNRTFVTSNKPNFAKQDLIGTYNKDTFQGINPNVHMSLEKLQEYFEVPIVNDRKNMLTTRKSINKSINVNKWNKYQKKALIVDAIKWTGFNIADVKENITNATSPISISSNNKLKISTLEGPMTANIGDYIIKGIKGEFYPCKPDVFEATYDVC